MEELWQRLRSRGERILCCRLCQLWSSSSTRKGSKFPFRSHSRRNYLLYFTIHDKEWAASIPLMRKWRCQLLGGADFWASTEGFIEDYSSSYPPGRHLSGHGVREAQSWATAIITEVVEQMQPANAYVGAWWDRHLVHQSRALFREYRGHSPYERDRRRRLTLEQDRARLHG